MSLLDVVKLDRASPLFYFQDELTTGNTGSVRFAIPRVLRARHN